MIWCWRCKMEVPMLDEVEYAQVIHLYSEVIRGTKDLRREKSLSLGATSLHELFRFVCDRHEESAGVKNCHENA